MSKYLIPEGFPESEHGYVVLLNDNGYGRYRKDSPLYATVYHPSFMFETFKNFALPVNTENGITFNYKNIVKMWHWGRHNVRKLDPSEIDFTRRAKIDENGNIEPYYTDPLQINGMLLYKIFVLNKTGIPK